VSQFLEGPCVVEVSLLLQGVGLVVLLDGIVAVVLVKFGDCSGEGDLDAVGRDLDDGLSSFVDEV